MLTAMACAPAVWSRPANKKVWIKTLYLGTPEHGYAVSVEIPETVDPQSVKIHSVEWA